MNLSGFELDPEIHQTRLYALGQKEPATTIDALEDYDPSRPTVLVLPGTRVNHEIPPRTLRKFFLKSMLNCAGRALRDENVNIGCVVYSHNDEQMFSNHFSPALHSKFAEGANDDPALPCGHDVRQFVRETLLPFAGIGTGARPSVDEACQKYSRLTLLGHSYGTTFAAESARFMKEELAAHHGYTHDEADRITSEIVVVGLASLARTDEAQRGFRTITFSGRRDPTTWSIMDRIAHDHYDPGLIQELDIQPTQAACYEACGYPPYSLEATPPRVPGSLERSARIHGGYGRLFIADIPEKLTWEIPGQNGPVSKQLSSIELNDEAMALTLLVEHERKTQAQEAWEARYGSGSGREFEGDSTGLNTMPLLRGNITLPHDHRTFLQPANENAKLVDKVQTVLKAALHRAVQPLERTPDQTIGEIAAARSRGADIVAIRA